MPKHGRGSSRSSRDSSSGRSGGKGKGSKGKEKGKRAPAPVTPPTGKGKGSPAPVTPPLPKASVSAARQVSLGGGSGAAETACGRPAARASGAAT
eukprot:13784809-Alexandrium_andersonii.AAC.1